MKTRHAIILSLSLGLFSASAAHAGGAVLGAVLGGGVGAVIGQQVGGREGTIIGGAIGAATGVIIASDSRSQWVGSYHAPAPVRAYAPAPVYTPVYTPVYVSTPVYYQAPRRVVHVPPPPPPRQHWQNRPQARHGAHRR